MGLGTSIKLDILATLYNALDLGQAEFPSALNQLYTWGSGTGANQADQLFSDERTLGTGANEDLDLAGSLSDAFGNTLTFARIKAVIVLAASANTTNITVSRPASNGVVLFDAASDAITLAPGALFAWVDPTATGKAVTAGTGDLLNIANSAGASGTYTVIIIGASA